ncbi:MAG: hypothetical protein IKH78_08135 [Ruminococcus sp.]|uniref:sigma factor-like helix-turn-helix DNA-binding protein n=1 Tax=Ralstonia pseudosolanacearum TaxID=1310165 RepID=UPI003D179778|nr:hypothetical protein [Ruminococcus sp.]
MKHSANLLQATNTSIAQAIDDYVSGKNAERDRKILRRRLIDGITFERIGEEFEISTNHAKRIIYSREVELMKHLNVVNMGVKTMIKVV